MYNFHTFVRDIILYCLRALFRRGGFRLFRPAEVCEIIALNRFCARIKPEQKPEISFSDRFPHALSNTYTVYNVCVSTYVRIYYLTSSYVSRIYIRSCWVCGLALHFRIVIKSVFKVISYAE